MTYQVRNNILNYKRINLFLLFILFFFSVTASPNTLAIKGKEAFSDSLKALAAAQNDDTSKVRILIALTRRLKTENSRQALFYAKEAMRISNKLNYIQGKADALSDFGGIYNYMADYKQALLHSLQALRIYETLDDKRNMRRVYIELGNSYMRLHNFTLAKQYYVRSLSLLNQQGLVNETVKIYINLGALAEEEGNTTEAILYAKKAFQIAKINDDNYHMAMALLNLGKLAKDEGRLNEGEHYFSEAIKLNHNRDNNMQQFAYWGLGSIALEHKEYKKAEKYLELAESLEIKTQMNDLLSYTYQSLYQLNREKRNFEKALKYYMLYSNLKNSISNTNTIRQVAEMQKAYEIEKKDKKIQLLNKDKIIVKAQAERERTSRNLFSAVLLFTFVISGVVARNMVLKQRVKNKALNEEKTRAEKDITKLLHENAEARYEVLKSKINPHFLFNSFTTLSSLIIEDPEVALRFIGRFSKLYRSILDTSNQDIVTLEKEMELVHHYLYLQKLRFGKRLVIDVRIDRQAHLLAVLPFSLQMTVENAIKHNAIPEDKNIYITISTDEDHVIISNNFNDRRAGKVSTSTGQKNITARYLAFTGYMQPDFLQQNDTYIVRLPLIKTKVQNRLAAEPVVS